MVALVLSASAGASASTPGPSMTSPAVGRLQRGLLSPCLQHSRGHMLYYMYFFSRLLLLEIKYNVLGALSNPQAPCKSKFLSS
jgi:hypothetical protein